MSIFRCVCFFLLMILAACDSTMDDLSPSSENLSVTAIAGTNGNQVWQIAPDFTLRNSLDSDVVLSAEVASANAVVLYFTMWCPICDTHMNYIRSYIMPSFTNVVFYFVDYVSGSVTASRQAQLANGYADVNVLVDSDLNVLNLYGATMGSTVVIDQSGTVLMNEDFRDGAHLFEVLQLIP